MSKPSRVLMVVLNLEVGGLERIVVELAARLAEQAHKVRVVTLRHGGVLAATLRERGIQVEELGLGDGIRIRNLTQLRAQIKAFEPDVVHSHGEAALFYSAMSRLSGLRFRHIHTRHGYEDISARGRIRNRLSYLGCDAVVCVSDDLSKHCETREGVNATKLYTVVNGVDLAPFQKLPLMDYVPLEPVIGHVARLVEIKNQRLLLDAFALLRKRLTAARLEIIGDGPMRQELEAHSHALGLEGFVRFHGESDRIPEKLSNCHIFCLSSDSEGTPVSVLEALAAGRPVVATAVGGLPKVITEKVGLLCPPGDKTALADGLFKVYEAADTYHGYSAAARSSAGAAQDIEGMLRGYLSIYDPSNAPDAARRETA